MPMEQGFWNQIDPTVLTGKDGKATLATLAHLRQCDLQVSEAIAGPPSMWTEESTCRCGRRRQQQSAPRWRLGTTFKLLGSGWGVAHGGRQRNAGRTNSEAAGGAWSGKAHNEALAVLLDLGIGDDFSGQEPNRPSAAMRSSSAFFSTRARKLQKE
jgi:hypothetical protein